MSKGNGKKPKPKAVKVSNEHSTGANSALRDFGEMKMPIPVACRISDMRTEIEKQLKKVEEVRTGIIKSLTGGQTTMDSKHDRWAEFAEKFNELMEREFTVHGQVTIYVRELEEEDAEGETQEYSFMRSFKSRIKVVEGFANTMHNARGLLLLEEVKREEDD